MGSAWGSTLAASEAVQTPYKWSTSSSSRGSFSLTRSSPATPLYLTDSSRCCCSLTAAPCLLASLHICC